MPQYCVGSISQALVSKRQLVANQGNRPFVLPQQLFLSGCHAILLFTGCAEHMSGSLLDTGEWDGVEVICDGVDVICDGVDVICDGVEVICDGVDVICDGVEVICDGVDVICDGVR